MGGWWWWWWVAAADPSDPLYTNWTKDRAPGVDIARNPIIEGSSDDPSTAWRTRHGEWRLLTNGDPNARSHAGLRSNSSFAPIYAARNFTGPWRYVGDSNMLAGECGSLFKLPALYPGTSAAGHQGPLPTHVHKRGCGPTATDSTTRANCRAGLNDHMTLGFWSDGSGVNDAGKFTAAGPERSVDKGCLYAGKDLHDVPNGRRLFWGWITCTTAGAQTLPRVVTYHPTLRQLVFSPAPELTKLHAGAPLAQLGRTTLKAKVPLALGSKAAKGAMAADWNISFARPKGDATVGLTFNTNFDAEGGAMTVFVNHTAGASQVAVGVYDGAPQYPCPAGRDVLQLLPTDEELTLRVFSDSHVPTPSNISLDPVTFPIDRLF